MTLPKFRDDERPAGAEVQGSGGFVQPVEGEHAPIVARRDAE